MQTTTVVMVFEKSTKNTHKYSAAANNSPATVAAFREIYIQKSAMQEPAKAIKVTVEVAA